MIKLQKLKPTVIRKRIGYGVMTLSNYAVLQDGVQVGRVFQHRATTMSRYAKASYGHETTRTMWAWESDDNGGDYELTSRREALDGLVEAISQ